MAAFQEDGPFVIAAGADIQDADRRKPLFSTLVLGGMAADAGSGRRCSAPRDWPGPPALLSVLKKEVTIGFILRIVCKDACVAASQWGVGD